MHLRILLGALCDIYSVTAENVVVLKIWMLESLIFRIASP